MPRRRNAPAAQAAQASPLAEKGAAAERAFLAGYDAARFPRPSLAVDVALLTVDERRLRVLLAQRTEHPHRGRWGLLGGFVGFDESIDAAATRVLKTKGGHSGVFLEQLYTFGAPGRDPRTRVISVAHYALVHPEKLAQPAPKGLALQWADVQVSWAGERGGPAAALIDGRSQALAFDHAEMLGLVVQRLRGKLNYAPIGFELLPLDFTLFDLQKVHEAILGRALNKDSFRRRMLASGLLAATGRKETAVGHRPAELFRFKRQTGR